MHEANIFLLGTQDTSNFLSDLGFDVKECEKKENCFPIPLSKIFGIYNID